MARGKKDSPEVVRITDAAESPSIEIDSRQRRYLLAMSIRTICFIAAVVIGAFGWVWLALIFILAAIVLPYVAVVIANAATPKGPESSPFGAVYTPPYRALPQRNWSTENTEDTSK